MGYFNNAIECYERAIELAPDYEAIYNYMGIVYEALGKQNKANDCFQKAKIISRSTYR